jgi:hypothetical protein
MCVPLSPAEAFPAREEQRSAFSAAPGTLRSVSTAAREVSLRFTRNPLNPERVYATPGARKETPVPLWRDPKTQRWKMRYYSDGTKAGPRVLETLESNLTHAEAGRVYKGRLARAATRKGKGLTRDLTMREAAAEYLASRKGVHAPGTTRTMVFTFDANILRLLGDRRLESLRPSDFLGYQTTRTAEESRRAP